MLTPDLTDAQWRKSTRSVGANNCVEIATGTVWRKSSRSNGATNCVEVANSAGWRKSSRSNGVNNCVELATGPAWAAVRDSKDPSGPALALDAGSFRSFAAALKSGGLEFTA